MNNVFVISFETVVLLLVVWSFVKSWEITDGNGKRIAYNPVRLILRLLFFSISLILYVISIRVIILHSNVKLEYPYIVFIISAIIHSFLIPGREFIMEMKNTDDSIFSRIQQTTIRACSVALFAMGFIYIGGSFISMSYARSTAEKHDYAVAVEEPLNINFDTTVGADDDYIYLFSDELSGINIYSLNGEYIKTFYFTPAQNGRAECRSFNGVLYIRNKVGTIFGYKEGEYYGKVEVENLENYALATVYDRVGEVIVSNIQVDYSNDVIAFDEEYVYVDDFAVPYKTNGLITSAWDGTYFILDDHCEVSGHFYELRENKLYRDGEVLISSSVSFYLFNNFFNVWNFLATDFFIITTFMKLLKIRKNRESISLS